MIKCSAINTHVGTLYKPFFFLSLEALHGHFLTLKDYTPGASGATPRAKGNPRAARLGSFPPAPGRAHSFFGHLGSQVWGLARKVSPDPVPRGHHTTTAAPVRSRGTRDSTPRSGAAPRARGRPPGKGRAPRKPLSPRAPSPEPRAPGPGEDNGPAPLHNPSGSQPTPTPRTSRRTQNRTSTRSAEPAATRPPNCSWVSRPAPRSSPPPRSADRAPDTPHRSPTPRAPPARGAHGEPNAEVCGEAGARGAGRAHPARSSNSAQFRE